MNFESKAFVHVIDYIKLLEEIDRRYANKRTYVFLDEIQVVDHWERAVNSLQTDYDVDIYTTRQSVTIYAGRSCWTL